MAAAAAAAYKFPASIKGQTAVIIGATGVVGQGVAWKYLEAGATVVAVGRDQKKLDVLRTALAKVATKDNFKTAIGDFSDEKAAAAALIAVKAVAPSFHHVVSIIGFANTSATGPTGAKLDEVKKSFEESLYPTFNAATAFLPPLKSVAGSSYTLVSGGLAHAVFFLAGWPASIKNAALNALGNGLAKETEKDAVRVNTICIHHGVAPFDGNKNQFGMDSADTRRLAPLFLTIAAGKSKGAIVCTPTIEDAEKLAVSLL
jgi:NAD(P)-dependent dehydrogenase (short-subunit alcohol dehydrogenase family)